MEALENYLGLMLAVLLALAFFYFWRGRRMGPRKKFAVSDEAAREIEGVLADYRRTASANRDRITDGRRLPQPKEIIKQYLQISIGLARLNDEAEPQLLEEYYQLANFQEADKGDEKVLPIVIRERQVWEDEWGTGSVQESRVGGQAGDVERKYLQRAVDERAALQKELEAFLKQKRLF